MRISQALELCRPKQQPFMALRITLGISHYLSGPRTGKRYCWCILVYLSHNKHKHYGKRKHPLL